MRFASANVSIAPETAARYMVMGLPTVVTLKGGQRVQQVTGAQSRDKVEKLLADLT